VLTLDSAQREAIIATCVRALPNEGCGLLLGTAEGIVRDVVASANVADSARILRATRQADDESLEVIGVFHSHTHSEAYPSPTDVRQAPDPAWHYVLVSLLDAPADLRSFRVVDGAVDEEELAVIN
jgi:proteasome lid subunit RPN8/RPN11